MPYVILLHFDAPVCENRPAQHYLEYAADPVKRIRDHTKGVRLYTAGIMYALHQRGIGFKVVRVWVNADRRDEYRLRSLRNNPKLCPICNPTLELDTKFIKRPNTKNGGYYKTIRLGDKHRARYGDLDTVRSFDECYKPRVRTRANGESNYTSGSASDWHAYARQAYAPVDDFPF